jgi:uncharacterized protein with HEPN domain
MPLSNRDAGTLTDIMLAARDAREFLAGVDEAAFMSSRLHQNAVIRALEVMGEAAEGVPATLRAGIPQLPWHEMIGMRHRLIHGYDKVDLDMVWSVATGELEAIIAAIEVLLPPPPGPR